MIFYFLITFCVLLAIAVTVAESHWDDTPGIAIGSGLVTLVFSGLISLLVFLMVFGILVPSNHTARHEQPLAALGNHSQTSGSFFLGSGSFDGDSYLTYILQGSDGSYQIQTDKAYSYKIFQDSTSGGSLVTYEDSLYAWWIAPFAFEKWSTRDSEFHIPAGSIQTGYNIDVNK